MWRSTFQSTLVIIPTLVAIAVVVPIHLATEHGDRETSKHHEGPDHSDTEHLLLTDGRPVTPSLDLPDLSVATAVEAIVDPPLVSSRIASVLGRPYHPPNDSYEPFLARAPPLLNV